MDAGENQSSGAGYWSVVRASEVDGEGVLSESAVVIANAVVNGDGLRFTVSEALVGSVGWIKAPGAIGGDGQAWDVRTKELEGESVRGIAIGSGESAADGDVVFCSGFGASECGDGGVVGAFDGDDKGVG